MKNGNSIENIFSKRRFRLIIAIPTLLLLFTISTGIINYQIIDIYREEFNKSGIKAEVFEELSDYMTITTACLGALSVVFGIGLAYSIIRPIKNLSESIRDVASGNLSKQVLITEINEIGELSSNFNTMLGSLQNLFKERNKILFESLSHGIITSDPAGTILTVNTAAEKILKTPLNNIIGKNVLNLLSTKDDYIQLKRIIEKCINDKVPSENNRITVNIAEDIKTDLSIQIIPFKDNHNNLAGFMTIFHDATMVDSLQNRLRHADQLAAIGTFSMGLAHEIRNPLCSIRSMAQMMKDKYPPDSKENKYSSLIVSESDRLNDLINHLLDFAHMDTSTPMECDVNELVSKAVFLSKMKSKSENTDTIKLIEKYSKNLPKIKLQKDKMFQAFLNILNNAWEFVDHNGTITIITKNSNDNKNSVLVEIINTGSVISEENKNKVFDPFYTTKDKGTGLGLPISYQIINSNGGTIYVKSENNLTAFTIELNAG